MFCHYPPSPAPPLCYEHELSAVALGGVAFAPGLSRPRRHRSCRIPPGTAAVSRRSPTVIKTGVNTRLGWLSDQDSNLNCPNSNLEERAVIAGRRPGRSASNSREVHAGRMTTIAELQQLGACWSSDSSGSNLDRSASLTSY